ncbi:ras-related protein Rab-26-like isoform X2 [Rhopilema esculentum]|uniref:ras-related protein Rab-26-like isoform X2 n=1 Tax=Rhopilema esculentum TaxID=499914 RepID=UPI0031DD3A99|eukprot:gene9560-17308_t
MVDVPDARQLKSPDIPEYKVMLIGDSGVGKTCVLVRFKDGAFLSGSFISTVGIDFKNKLLVLDGSKIKLQIWDTAGQERFRSITHAYYRDAHALLLLYDVSSRKSFENSRAWLSEIQEYATGEVVVMLLGNKADLAKEKVVKREEGAKLAKDFQVPFLETSAKSGMNIELAFEAAARELVKKQGSESNVKKFDISTYVLDKEQKPGCCGGS